MRQLFYNYKSLRGWGCVWKSSTPTFFLSLTGRKLLYRPPPCTVRARLQPTHVCLMMIMVIIVLEVTLNLFENVQPKVTLIL